MCPLLGGRSSSKFHGGLKSIYGGEGAWEGGGLKMLLKNTCEGVHFIVMLSAFSVCVCVRVCVAAVGGWGGGEVLSQMGVFIFKF